MPDTEDQPGRALTLAYRHLNRRARTVSELRAQLLGKGFEADVIDAAIRELLDQGYLDDARFAQAFVQDKRTLEQWGVDRIRRGLQARGIDRELVDSTLASEDSEDDGGELSRAVALLRRRFPSPPRDRRERERALGVLVRKGYEYELAVEAVGEHAARG